MKLVIQRVIRASVQVDGNTVGEIGPGLLILVGVVPTDTQKDIDILVRKTAALRIFDDANGVMNLSVRDVDGEILAVSQFTLCADIHKGNRPSYIGAAPPEIARPIYDRFCMDLAQATGKLTQKGIFGADMKVSLINDGPVTILADSADLLKK